MAAESKAATAASDIAPTAPEAAGSAAPAETAVVTMTAREACERLSETDRRMEMISAFYAEEVAAGRHIDTVEAYRGRLDSFAKREI